MSFLILICNTLIENNKKTPAVTNNHNNDLIAFEIKIVIIRLHAFGNCVIIKSPFNEDVSNEAVVTGQNA